MKHVTILNDGDESVTIVTPSGKEITIEPGGELPTDGDVTIQLGTGNEPK